MRRDHGRAAARLRSIPSGPVVVLVLPPSFECRARHAMVADTVANATNTPYPMVHRPLCSRSRSVGSTIEGYETSANMLPRLLVAYKKYGSWALGWTVSENHFWKTDALVDSTKKKCRPIMPGSTTSNQPIGLPS